MSGTNPNPVKRIIIFSAFYEPFISGAERFVKEVCGRLQGDRFVFTIVTAKLVRSQKPEVGDRNGIRIVRVGLGFGGDKYLYPLLAPIAALRLRPEIVHAVMESYAGIALWIFGLLRPRVPRILTLQSGDLDDKIGRSPFAIRGARGVTIPFWLWRKIHASPHRVTAISEYLANRARRLGVPDERISVIPNGVDFDKISDLRFKISDLGEQEKRIVCIARLSHEKGVDVLLRAFAQIGLPSTVYRLQLIGDGPQRAGLESLAQSLGIADRVIFRGALPHEKALRELAQATVAVVPSRAEGLSIAAIEAQALGIPVVGTRVGGIPEVIEDGVSGLLVPPEDPEAMARAIERLIADRGLRERLSVTALERVQKFDWDAIAEKMAEVYKAIHRGSTSVTPEVEPRPIANRRIVLAAGIFPPAVGGPATFAHELAHGFVREGRRVEIVTFDRGARTHDGEAPCDLSIVAITSSGNTLLRYVRMTRALVRAARGAEAICAFDAVGSGIPAAIAAGFTGRPLIIRVGGDFFWEDAMERGEVECALPAFWRERHAKSRLVAFRLVRWAFSRAKTVVFNSEWLRDIYVRAGLVSIEKTAIIDNARPSMYDTDHPREPFFVYAGRFIKLKNINRLIEAFAQLRLPTADCRLLIVGDGPERERLLATVVQLGLEDCVEILPPMPREALLELLGRATAAVLPSLSEVNPNFAIEALSRGTPVVVSRATGLSNDLKSLVAEIDPCSVGALAEAMRALMNPDAWRMHHAKIREGYAVRSIDRVAEEYISACAFPPRREHSPQVSEGHYHRQGYVTDERWMSFYHQYNLVLQTAPASVLEIGVGRGTVTRELKKESISVTTLDIDPALVPDLVGSVTRIPARDASYDTVLCAEVLEHIPWDEAPRALRELHRVCRRAVVLSLPHWGITLRFSCKLPFLRNRTFFFKIPWLRRHQWNGEHYWEIGKRGYPLRLVRKKIREAGFCIVWDGVYPDDPAHHFFILTKR